MTHDRPDLKGILRDSKGTDLLDPGSPVMYRDQPDSYGICVARHWGPSNKPMQCEVLWSRPPRLKTERPRDLTIEALDALDRKVTNDVLCGHGSIAKAMAADADIISIEVEHWMGGNSAMKIKRHSREKHQDMITERYNHDGSCRSRKW